MMNASVPTANVPSASRKARRSMPTKAPPHAAEPSSPLTYQLHAGTTVVLAFAEQPGTEDFNIVDVRRLGALYSVKKCELRAPRGPGSTAVGTAHTYAVEL
jgi:hypothetical protein